MIAKTEILLEAPDPLRFQMSSLFHGCLMELMPESLADSLHSSQMHPYAQHLEKRGDQWYWVISTMDEQVTSALDHILDTTRKIQIKKHDLEIGIASFSRETLEDKELRDLFYEGPVQDTYHIRFLTPTSFKSKGEYLIYPDIRCIFQSLMLRYDLVCAPGFFDEETLDALTDNTKMTRYKLWSTSFSLEGVRIPSFLGEMNLRMRGTDTMKRLAGMLFRFSEYSGVGIKTAMGMGAVSISGPSSAKMKAGGTNERKTD